MSLVKTLQHLFLPHESNNQKAKILHPSSLFTIAAILLVFQLGLNLIPKTFPQVLGYASSISTSDVIRLTNEKRKEIGLSPLTESKTLDSAALAKGQDMLAKGYWAHFAPDGTSPWSFFTKFGYNYRFAGENLARDFSSADSAVAAWMNSPSHKENLLNPNYKEIGIGVVEGGLKGVDTTIIVQFFGSKQIKAPSIPNVKAEENVSTVSAEAVSSDVTSGNAVVSPLASTKSVSLAVVGILLMVLSVDLVLIRKGRIARIGGRTLAHIAYFGMILAVILILKAGQVI